jgi:ATP-dependent Clp protease, protease subunit
MYSSEEFRKYAVKHLGISGTATDQYMNSVTNLTPNIIEERHLNATILDVFSRLMMDRIIFMGTGVNDHVANIITAQLLFLESVDSAKDITMYINSPGGSVYAGLGIYDTMHYIKPDVSTVCTGLAASMGAVLLAGGTAGKRAALPHARVMIHQPMSGTQGQISDMEIAVKEGVKLKKELYDILSKHTGRTYEEIERDSDRDCWMIAEEAKAYGLIDEVLIRNK